MIKWKYLIIFPLVASAISGTSCMFIPEDSENNKKEISISDMTLVWADEFDSGTAPNTDYWSYETGAGGWGNNEKQTYTADSSNVYVSDGTLKIKAIKDSYGTWTSGRIKTAGKKYWKYGYVEANIKLPEGNSGIWPAFWMMPNESVYGSWPRSGEIDIMEYSPGSVANACYSTLHHSSSEADAGTDVYPSLGRTVIDNRTNEFHKYGILWTQDYIETFYDGKSLGTQYLKGNKNWVEWPYDQNFFIILNLAMGGNLGKIIPSDLTEATYEIDYVRVYQ